MANPCESDQLEEIELRVTVSIDSTSDELRERLDNSAGAASPADVVRSEVESNLESVPYVQRASVDVLHPEKEEPMEIKVVPAPEGSPAGKLADAELHFTDEPLVGLKLVGFGIWEGRSGGGQSVTFPSRQYTVNGERRSFTLLRALSGRDAADSLRDQILAAYAAADGVPSPAQ